MSGRAWVGDDRAALKETSVDSSSPREEETSRRPPPHKLHAVRMEISPISVSTAAMEKRSKRETYRAKFES